MAAAIGALARASMHKRVPALLRVHGDAVSFAWPPEILSPKPQHGWLLTGRVRRAAPRGRTVGIICEARANAAIGRAVAAVCERGGGLGWVLYQSLGKHVHLGCLTWAGVL